MTNSRFISSCAAWHFEGLSIMENDPVNWSALLRQPEIPTDFTEEEIYRAACIGAVSLLYEAGAAAALQETVRYGSAPESRIRALVALENLARAADPSQKTALHLLYELAVLDGNPEAALFLRRTDLQDEDQGWNSARMLLFGQKHQLLRDDPGPRHLSELFICSEAPLRFRLLSLSEKTLPNWCVLMRFLHEPSEKNRLALLDAFPTFSPDERKLLSFLAGQDPHVSSAAADILLRYEDETVRELCVENGLLPSDSSQLSLFYFLSGQWERYYESDSDYRYIRIAYEGRDPVLQRRLIAVSRDSGNSAWLREVSGGTENLPDRGGLSDQHLLAASLIEQCQWSRLWELLPNLPLLCMAPVCEALQSAGFVPDRADEQEFFRDLSEKVKACEGLSPVPLHKRYAEGNGSAIGICGGGPFFAVLYTDRRILVWDTRAESDGPIKIQSSHLSFRRAVISHDGKYLCADCGKDGLSVFSLPGGQAVKTFASGGAPLAGLFVQADDRRLITLSQSGKGMVFAFPGGTELFNFDLGLKDCSRAAYDSAANRLCGISSDGICMVYDLNGRRPLNGVRLDNAVLAGAEKYASGRLAVIEAGEVMDLLNLLSAKPVFRKNLADASSVRRILPLAENELFVLGSLDGQIRIYDPTAENFPAILSTGSKTAVTGLWYDADKALLYGCNSVGAVRSWDLGLFREMMRVLPLTELPGMNRIDAFVKKYPEPGVKAAAELIKTAAAWRRRFDIDIEF